MTDTGTGPFRVVRRYDPAIGEGSDVLAYARSGGVDTSVLVFDGAPVWFTCRPLRLSERRDVRSAGTESDRFERAFSRGVVRVEGYHFATGARDWTRPDDKRALSDSELEGFAEVDVLEIGAVIWGRSMLGKDVPQIWPLPAISADVLRARAYRLAEQTRRAEPSDESKRPVEETETGQP